MPRNLVMFLTGPNNVDMQRELQQRADVHCAKQRESEAAGRLMNCDKPLQEIERPLHVTFTGKLTILVYAIDAPSASSK
ncbi:MAG TPA: hypothetical protein VEU97_11350 [Ktedonobacteraceae bacterium]|nr:hypothetical protein [Ktedonobacteraceae bacterium]